MMRSLILGAALAAATVTVPVERRPRRAKANSARGVGGVPIHNAYAKSGEFWINATIGGQPAGFLLDTGSSDLGVLSTLTRKPPTKDAKPYDPTEATGLGCDWCRNHTAGFDKKTCAAVRGEKEKLCTYSISYEDGSGYSAALFEDAFSFGGGAKATRTAVGAFFDDEMDDPRAVSGIVGFAGVAKSESGAPTPFDDLVAAGGADDVFALCMPSSKVDGSLYLGSAGGAVAGVALAGGDGTTWTKMATDGLYVVDVADLLVGGASVGVSPAVYNKGGAILDSGTSQVGFPKSAWDAAIKTFGRRCADAKTRVAGLCDVKTGKALDPDDSIASGECFQLEAADLAKYPPLAVKFADGAVLEIPADEYLTRDPKECAGMQKGWYTIDVFGFDDDASGTILGDVAMFGKVVVHDRVKKRAGFKTLAAGAGCP